MAKDLKTAVFCWGRFNPPTIGHGKLLDALISVAKRKGGRNSDTFVLVSHSVDPEKNPLTKEQKVFYLKKMFPKQMKYYDVELNKKKLFLRLIAIILNKYYERLIMVVGSDRVREFQTELDKFNGATGDDAPLKGASYNYKEIEVVSAGERDPDAEGISGMSASKMRAAAADGDLKSFKSGVPRGFGARNTINMMNDVRKGMGLDSLKRNESLMLKTYTKFKKEISEGITKLYGLSIKELLDSVLNFKGKTLIYFDTETMGLSPKKDYLQLTEIAAIAFDGSTFKEIDKIDYKVNLLQVTKDVLKPGTPERINWDSHVKASDKMKTPQQILKMTRYGSKTAAFIKEVHALKVFFEFIGKFTNPVLIAHNAPFDLKYLGVRAKKYGITMKKYESLDTLELNKMYFIPLLKSVEGSKELDVILKSLSTYTTTGKRKVSSTLGNLSSAMKIDVKGWHNALADVEMLMGVLAKMVEMFKKYQDVDISKLHRGEVLRVAKSRHKRKHTPKRKKK